MFEYALACIGSNLLYVLARYGVVAAIVQTTQSLGTIVICQSTIGASLTTATAISVITTTPLCYAVYFISVKIHFKILVTVEKVVRKVVFDDLPYLML